MPRVVPMRKKGAFRFQMYVFIFSQWLRVQMKAIETLMHSGKGFISQQYQSHTRKYV